MFRRISKAERSAAPPGPSWKPPLQALHANERAFKEAQDPFYIEQLDLPARRPAVPLPGAASRILRADRENL